MADLKLNGATPDGIALGSTKVKKVYSGTTLVWPLIPGEVEICDLIWTDTNSSETELIAGGNIPILTNGVQWFDHWAAQTPAACYWNFDVNNASYGLIYNYFARNLVKIPIGFRLPTPSDFNTLDTTPCFPSSPPTGNKNRYGAKPGDWEPSLLTNTTELGDSGFDSQGYGYTVIASQSQGGISFVLPKRAEGYWTDIDSNNLIGWGLNIGQSDLTSINFSFSNAWGLFIRFVKDA